MRRREFIALLGGAAAWPLAARAQQGEQVRRIGALAGGTGGERPEFTAFRQGLNQLGWRDGGNVRIEYRWGSGNACRHTPIRGGTGWDRAGCHPGGRRFG